MRNILDKLADYKITRSNLQLLTSVYMNRSTNFCQKLFFPMDCTGASFSFSGTLIAGVLMTN